MLLRITLKRSLIAQNYTKNVSNSPELLRKIETFFFFSVFQKKFHTLKQNENARLDTMDDEVLF